MVMVDLPFSSLLIQTPTLLLTYSRNPRTISTWSMPTRWRENSKSDGWLKAIGRHNLHIRKTKWHIFILMFAVAFVTLEEGGPLSPRFLLYFFQENAQPNADFFDELNRRPPPYQMVVRVNKLRLIPITFEFSQWRSALATLGKVSQRP